MYRIVLGILLVVCSSTWAITPEIHSITYKSGATFHHFQLELTKENLLLPSDFPDRKQLDDTTDNFKYGQFEVFIPAKHLQLPMGCKSNYIARMGQTLGRGKENLIKEKQNLYKSLVEVYEGKLEAVNAVFEMTYKNGCNIFFRTSKGRYVDYLGTVKK